jgi:hypothetical protein
MNPHTTKSLLGLLTLSVLGSTGCTNSSGESVGTTQSDLINTTPIGPGSGGRGIGPTGGGGSGTIPVNPPTAFQASATTSDTVTLTWNEPGGNGTTILYRQLYDLEGNATGGLDTIATFNALPKGPVTFLDQNSTARVPTSPIHKLGGLTIAALQPDHQVGYQIVEVASGFTTCENVPGGNTCAYSPLIDAYLQGTVPYGIGRAQLRIQVSEATAHASSLHVRTELSAWAATWLDSTQGDFKPGSEITYDLKTDYLDGRSDINFIDLWTPDSDGICVSDILLKVDNTTTFHQSFATCQWVGNGGGEIDIPFAALRSSAAWQAYTPELFVPSTLKAPVTFVGFDSAGLIAHLDATIGDALKNEIPSASAGYNAGLGAPTTISRTDSTHLHVQQHLVNLDVSWDDIDFGSVNADPTYDLVIHNADSVCTGWCIRVEDPSGNSSLGWAGAILDLINLGIVPFVEHEINDHLQSSLQDVSGLSDPGTSFGFCFVPATVDHANPGPFYPSYSDDGTPVTFGEGSLTICPEF